MQNCQELDFPSPSHRAMLKLTTVAVLRRRRNDQNLHAHAGPPRWIAPRKPHRSTRKANFAAARRYLNPGGGGINVARAVTFLGGKATAIFPVGGATGEHLAALLADEQVPVETVETRDWTRQNLHVHVAASGEQYRFVMPGAALTDDEFRRLEEKVLTIEPGSLLVVSGSLPPVLASIT